MLKCKKEERQESNEKQKIKNNKYSFNNSSTMQRLSKYKNSGETGKNSSDPMALLGYQEESGESAKSCR